MNILSQDALLRCWKMQATHWTEISLWVWVCVILAIVFFCSTSLDERDIFSCGRRGKQNRSILVSKLCKFMQVKSLFTVSKRICLFWGVCESGLYHAKIYGTEGATDVTNTAFFSIIGWSSDLSTESPVGFQEICDCTLDQLRFGTTF